MTYFFDEDQAIRYGVDEAIMINNLAYWISHNKANEKHFYDGRYWTYNSRTAFVDLFQFWNERQIRRILDSLVEQQIIIKGNYNKLKKDHTCWYAFENEADFLVQSDRTKKSNLAGQKSPIRSDKKVQPLPDKINTDNKPDNKHTDKSNIDSDKSSSFVFTEIVDFWLKDFHKGWFFEAVDGKSLKLLITKIKKILVAHGRLAGDQEVIDFFIKMCHSLPVFYQTQGLSTLNHKFNEIITAISESRTKERSRYGGDSVYRN